MTTIKTKGFLMRLLLWLLFTCLISDLTFSQETRQITYKPELVVSTGHSSQINSIVISPNGKILASGSDDDLVKLWDIDTKQELKTFSSHTSDVLTVAFSPNGKVLASGGKDKTIKLRYLNTEREEITFVGHTSYITALAFSPDGKYLVSGSDDKTIKIWDLNSNSEIKSLVGHTASVNSVVFSPDGKLLASCGGKDDNSIKIWNFEKANEIKTLYGHTDSVNSITFSPKGNILISGSDDKTIRFWNVETGSENKLLNIHNEAISSITISHSGNKLYSASKDGKIKLWDLEKETEIKELKGFSLSIALSPNDEILATTNAKEIELRDLASGLITGSLKSHSESIFTVAVNPNGGNLAFGTKDKTVKVWDFLKMEMLGDFPVNYYFDFSVLYSPDGKLLASREGSQNSTGEISFPDQIEKYNIWKLSQGEKVKIDRLPEWIKKSAQSSLILENKKELTIISGGNKVDIKETSTEKTIANLYFLDKKDWVLVDREGRWDATENAQKLMYYSVSTPDGYKTISLDQMKVRYYFPGLFNEILKGKNLESVEKFDSVALFPKIEAVKDKNDKNLINVKLFNQGGGIGKVKYRINGKEFELDPEKTFNPDQNQDFRQINIQSQKKYLLPNQENKIEFFAFNKEEYLQSRGSEIIYLSDDKEVEPPNLWVLVVGVSDYQGDTRGNNSLRDLSFADKDADAISATLKMSGERLFPNRTFIKTLSSDSDIKPTKSEIVKILTEIAEKAKSTDTLIIHFSGHGIGFKDSYYFLTADAYTPVLDDREVREKTSLSDLEIAGLMKRIAAKRQVLILDTCAAGKFLESEKNKTKDIEPDIKRAWDRMKDSAGLWILAGSAANAVSYESSRYGQGVLTYSILYLLKNKWYEVLRKDEQSNTPEFIDVSQLFNFTIETVPGFADEIGGIQRPILFLPSDAKSFDIGRFKVEDHQNIPLPNKKRIFTRSNFQLTNEPDDLVGISDEINLALRKENSLGTKSNYLFWDYERHPSTFRISGRYEIINNSIKLSLVVYSFDQEGKSNKIGESIINGEKNKLPELALSVIKEANKIIDNSKIDNN